jgi:hypothetical protein
VTDQTNKSHSEDKKLQSALYYLTKCNFSVIPCKPDKKPHIQWQQYQKERPSEDQVKEWWGKQFKFANIGIVTGSISGLTVIDVDTQTGMAKLNELLPDSWLTPTVDTPGRGAHFYCKYEDSIGNAVRFMDGCDIRSEGGYVIAPPSSDTRGAWKWRKACRVSELALNSIPNSILQLFSIARARVPLYTDQHSPENPLSTNDNISTNFNKSTNINILDFNEGSRDNSLFHVANCLSKGGMPDEEIEQLLSLIASNICNPPFPIREIPSKVKSATQRHERRERNLTEEVRELIRQHSGNISSTFVQQSQQMSTIEDRKKIWVILNRLEKEGMIQRTGKVAGEYRIVEHEENVVNAADIQIEKGIDISLPFMLEHYVEILPKDLIVVAGTPNAGKTALLLDMVARNQDKFECWYFSTEMGQQACARRLAMRDPHIDWKFKFVQDFGAYEDVIKPDALNFIDYVEQNEGEAFKIPGILAKIQRKLKNGVAVVALQKNRGKGWAVGGEQTRAKPTLFLSVESDYPGQILRIEKAKAFKDYNPNGFYMKFKIVKGINLVNMTDWGPEIA